ncbi:MAG: extracellular solute-binding protein [Saccharofermentanales bacterium]
MDSKIRLEFIKTAAAVLISFSVCASAGLAILADQDAQATGDGVSSYAAYRKANDGLPSANAESDPVVIDATQYDKETSADVSKGSIDGYNGTEFVFTADKSIVVFPFEISKAGYYAVYVEYYPTEGSGGKILRTIALDGAVPCKEFYEVEFDRIWTDKTAPGEVKDIYGNDIRPVQIESPKLNGDYIRDPSGFYQTPLAIYAAEGSHTLTLLSVAEPMAVASVRLVPAAELPDYDTVKALWSQKSGNKNPETIIFQAEQSSSKSERTLYPMADRSSPDSVPYDYKLQKINTIGGVRWKRVGQWIEWSVDVPEDGFYKLSLRWKQDTKMNDVSARELSIDGNVPFNEALNLQFGYAGGWQVSSLADPETGEAYSFYLSGGTHTIRLKASLGEYSSIVSAAQDILYELNKIYRQIVMITGPTPDQFRDYEFDKTIPGTLAAMTAVNTEIKALETDVRSLTQGGGQSTATLERLIYQIGEMTADVETIAYRLNDFQNNISGLGSWMNQVKEQPLELDCLILSAMDYELPRAEANFLQVVMHYLRQFFVSFTIDYAEIGTIEANNDESITVWIGSGVGTTAGRDQSQLIRQLISEKFTTRAGISAKLQLVSMGSLLPATLAGIGPDIALQQPQADPLNFALRNAVYDLSQFEDYESVLSRFYPSATDPFRLEDKLFALPETQSYPMLYYRKDILEELGIDESMLDTWDSLFLSVLPKIQKSYLQLGILSNMNSYAMFLYQNGGTFYTEDSQQSAIGTPQGIAAFEKFTGIYTEYKQSLTFDFANRFRTGAMPIAINDFTVYNQLSVFAPELKGLWAMRPVPGTIREDGTLDRSVASGVSGCIMLASSSSKEDAWAFMKWWTEAETQAIYGRELESIMGDAARYPTANIEAMGQMQWDAATKESLAIQQKFAKAVPEVPGGYFTSRHMDFAFRDVILSGRDVRETITKAQSNISDEIVSKRIEFELPVSQEYLVGGND